MPKMKPHHYRKTNYCNDCPFLTSNGENIHLDAGRLDKIKADLLSGENFVCHKTIFGDDKDRRMCYGAYKFLRDKDKPNQIMQLADRIGVEDD